MSTKKTVQTAIVGTANAGNIPAVDLFDAMRAEGMSAHAIGVKAISLVPSAVQNTVATGRLYFTVVAVNTTDGIKATVAFPHGSLDSAKRQASAIFRDVSTEGKNGAKIADFHSVSVMTPIDTITEKRTVIFSLKTGKEERTPDGVLIVQKSEKVSLIKECDLSVVDIERMARNSESRDARRRLTPKEKFEKRCLAEAAKNEKELEKARFAARYAKFQKEEKIRLELAREEMAREDTSVSSQSSMMGSKA